MGHHDICRRLRLTGLNQAPGRGLEGPGRGRWFGSRLRQASVGGGRGSRTAGLQTLGLQPAGIRGLRIPGRDPQGGRV